MNETKRPVIGRYYIQTYGCQMNEHDSEILAGILERAGYQAAQDPKAADVILLNTCAVRDTAVQRVLGELGRLKIYKYENPDMILGVCGCMPMESGAVERIRQRASHIDLILGTGQLERLPELLASVRRDRCLQVEVSGSDELPPADLPRRRQEGVRAWVPIIYGCNNFCSYCIVPYVRGRERSRPPAEILDDIKTLVADGVREITLLGQNVNSYGHDLAESIDFGGLLAKIDAIEGLKWIRYTTSHPRDFSLELVDQIKALEKVCSHFHLPVQSGSNRILKRMNRGYTREEYLALIKHIEKQFPDASITTDVIVGFPGETEADFQETLDLFERARFDGAFSFIYSPRPKTAAANYPDDLPKGVKKERLQRLNERQYPISLEKNQRLLGFEAEVLLDRRSDKNPRHWRARTATNKLVLVEAPPAAWHQFAHVRITAAETFQLRGELVRLAGNENSHHHADECFFQSRDASQGG